MTGIATRFTGATILAAALCVSSASFAQAASDAAPPRTGRMSGAADRPVMKEPEMRREFDEMRRQMNGMSKARSMPDPARSK